MVTKAEMKNRIYSLVSFLGFDYEGVACGVDPINHSCYNMWYGDNDYTAKDIEEVMSVPLFNGKSLSQIYNSIEIIEM